MGGVLAGIGGSFLSLYYPGNWNERISTGQGLMAVALVIFARWDPVQCLWASLLFGGVGSVGLALQGQDLTDGGGRLPVEHRPLRPDPGHHDPDLVPRPRHDRGAAGTEPRALMHRA